VKKKTAGGNGSVTQKLLFGHTVLAALMSGRKYSFIPQNGDSSEKSML
jgi:hypothetical protein